MAEDETKTLLEKIHKATVKQATIMGTISTAVKGIPGMLLGLFTDAITTGAKMEEQVAKLGASFGSFGKDMFKASEAFQKAGIPINVYEAMILELQSNRLGLDMNNASMSRLYKVSLATGESFNTWGQGILDATIGTRESTESQGKLALAVENNSRAFNMTRSELVGALKSLNRSTINLFGATGGSVAAAGEFTTLMKGLLPDQALFGEAMNTFTRQFTMQGLTESIALGFPVEHFLTGNATAAQMLEATLDQGDAAQSLLSKNGRNAIIGNAAMQAAFGDLLSKISVKEAILKKAEMLLSKTEMEGLTNKEIAERVQKDIAQRASDAQDLTNTWNMVKREIVTPFINEGAKFFIKVKELFGAAWLRDALRSAFTIFGKIIFGIGTLLVSAIQHVAKFFGFTELAKSMDEVKNSANALGATWKSGMAGGGAGGGGTTVGSNMGDSAAEALKTNRDAAAAISTAKKTPTTAGGAVAGAGAIAGAVAGKRKETKLTWKNITLPKEVKDLTDAAYALKANVGAELRMKMSNIRSNDNLRFALKEAKAQGAPENKISEIKSQIMSLGELSSGLEEAKQKSNDAQAVLMQKILDVLIRTGEVTEAQAEILGKRSMTVKATSTGGSFQGSRSITVNPSRGN